MRTMVVGGEDKLGHSGDLCPVQSVHRQLLMVEMIFFTLQSQNNYNEEECQDGGSNDNDETADLGFSSSKPGCHDKDRNLIMTVVNCSGVHELGIS